jgi:hypothetical protein
MTYPTYEDARAHEKELLRLAQPYRVAEPEPDSTRRRSWVAAFAAFFDRRSAASSRPALAR